MRLISTGSSSLWHRLEFAFRLICGIFFSTHLYVNIVLSLILNSHAWVLIRQLILVHQDAIYGQMKRSISHQTKVRKVRSLDLPFPASLTVLSRCTFGSPLKSIQDG